MSMRAVASSVRLDLIDISCSLSNESKYLCRASASVRLEVWNVDNLNAASPSEMAYFPGLVRYLPHCLYRFTASVSNSDMVLVS